MRPLIALTFDDANLSDYTMAYYHVLSKYCLRGSSYVVTSRLIEDHNHLFWDLIKRMYRDGWCFGCHTADHVNLMTLTDAQIRAQMENVDTAFINNGLPAPKHMAYPWGEFDIRVKTIVSEYRETMRTVDNRIETYNTIDLKNLFGYGMDDLNIPSKMANAKSVIDQTVNSNGILVPMFHNIHDGYLPYFKEIIEYAINANFRFVTLDELQRLCNEYTR